MFYYFCVCKRDIQWISVLESRAGRAPTGPLHRRSGRPPEAWASASWTWEEPRRPPWRFCCRGNTKEVRPKILYRCFDFIDMFLATARLLPYVARRSDVSHFSQRVCTMARRTPMETYGTQFWGKSWNASCALAPMGSRTANASHAPASTHASTLWSQQESAVRLVQVV